MRFPTSQLAIDTETTGRNPFSPKTRATHISWWTHEGEGDVIEATDDRAVAKIGQQMVDRSVLKIMFNAAYDAPILEKMGLELKGPVVDASLMARMTFPQEDAHTLKHFARKFLNEPYLEEVELRKYVRQYKINVRESGYRDVPLHILHPYALLDAKMHFELFHFLSGPMTEYGLWGVLKREMKLMRQVVLGMISRGVQVDKSKAQSLYEQAQVELAEIKKRIRSQVGEDINPNSSQQVSKAVYSGGVLPSRFSKKTGMPSTDALALLELDSELTRDIATFRKISKASNTYLKNVIRGVDSESVLRVSFNQGGARTGRFSSSGYEVKVNLQNIPRKDDSVLGRIREIFVPRQYYRFALIDYDQVEMRLCAHFTEDQNMIRAIHGGEDLHSATCRRVFKMRDSDSGWDKMRYVSKTLNFAVIYGTGAQTFRDSVLKGTDGEMVLELGEARDYILAYKEAHPALMELFDRTAYDVATKGGIVNAFGRFIPVDPSKPYVAVNYLIQGTAADLIKLKMLAVQELLDGTRSALLMQIHDELITEVHQSDGIELVRALGSTLEEKTRFSVPLTVSKAIAKNWRDKKEIA